MEKTKEFAKITTIKNLNSIKIRKLSWLESKRVGHLYGIIVNGKTQCYSCPVDRIVLKHIDKITLDKLNEVELYSTKELMKNIRLDARITQYPDKEYSVLFVYNPIYEEREKLIDKLLREDDSYSRLAKLSYLIDGYHKIISKKYPKKTICPECKADDFAHVEGCTIGNDIDAWWEEQEEVIE